MLSSLSPFYSGQNPAQGNGWLFFSSWLTYSRWDHTSIPRGQSLWAFWISLSGQLRLTITAAEHGGTEATTSIVLSGVLSRTSVSYLVLRGERDFLRFFLFHQSWFLFSVVTPISTPEAEHSPLYPSPWNRFWTFPFCPSLYFIFYSIWSMTLNFWSFSFYLPSRWITGACHHACFMQCWGPDWGLCAY